MKEVKSKVAESGCCESKPEEKVTPTPQQASKSGCGCDAKEASEKKEEQKQSSCCQGSAVPQSVE